jgi:PAS domain S-box-containing protein
MNRAVPRIDLESIPGTVILADASGVIEYVNQQCLEATGYRSDEMVGNPLIDFWEISSESLAAILRHLQQKPVWRDMIWQKKKDGTHFQEVCAVSKLPAADQEGFCLLKVGQPVESSLLRGAQAPAPGGPPADAQDDSGWMQADYRVLFDTAPYGMAVHRISDQRYLLCNQAFGRYTGYSPEEIKGKTIQELNLFHDPADWERMRDAIGDQGKLDGFEVTFRRKDYQIGRAHV